MESESKINDCFFYFTNTYRKIKIFNFLFYKIIYCLGAIRLCVSQ
jgi:hypothetical protein